MHMSVSKELLEQSSLMEMHRTAAGAAINLIFLSGQGHSLIASILRETTHPGAATITRNLKQLKSTVR